ncbi:MAG: hypothetical protein M1828_003024 [Chrysothrix sp. TS-e1954]|nr:MAG: hypothetical protein M1828_003024 [Chrysothrix sp. TS-e1954]
MSLKWLIITLQSIFDLMTIMSASFIAPALPAIANDLHIENGAVLNVCLSIFVLSFAFGPLLLGPMSETFGRRPGVLLSGLFYFIWNLAAGFSKTKGLMIAGRLLSGLGASDVYVVSCSRVRAVVFSTSRPGYAADERAKKVGYGILNDLFPPSQRGLALSMFSLIPLLGSAVGPIVGGVITQHTTWRWIFWSTSAFDALLLVAFFLFSHESYPPVLLARKAASLRKSTGNTDLHTEYDTADSKLSAKLSRSLARPFRMLAFHPIIQLLAIYNSFTFGTLFLVLTSFSSLYTSPSHPYHLSVQASGLQYIAIVIGESGGAQLLAPLTDRLWARMQRRHGTAIVPEYRVPLMLPSTFLVPIGLLWYGWSAQAGLHWIMPDIGAGLFAAGFITSSQTASSYVIDAYGEFSASGMAGTNFARSLAAFGMPLFAPAMYERLGYGWGNSLLAGVGAVTGTVVPAVLWWRGRELREKVKGRV